MLDNSLCKTVSLSVLQAHKTCQRCSRAKKKCDKVRPVCGRCENLRSTCAYNYTVEPAILNVAVPGVFGDEFLKRTTLKIGPFDWLSRTCDFSGAQILQLLASHGVDWEFSIEVYFRTVNSWLTIVHRQSWEKKLLLSFMDAEPQCPEIFLVISCMHIVGQFTIGTSMLENPLYRDIKSIWLMKKGFTKPSVELIQCGMLIALYEYGHGNIVQGYQTLGEAVAMAKCMGIKPGKYIEEEKYMPVHGTEEQNRIIYWSLMVLDRITHEECPTIWTPLQIDPPTDDDLLPTEIFLWDKTTQSYVQTNERYPANVGHEIALGTFHRTIQACIILGHALMWEHQNVKSSLQPCIVTFLTLESITRSLIEAVITQSDNWMDHLNTYAILPGILVLLFSSFLCSVDTSMSTPEISKAVLGLQFTVRLVTDGTASLIDKFSRNSELLEKCGPPWPYVMYYAMKVLWNYEAMQEAKVHDSDLLYRNMKSIMGYFAQRWGVADHLLQKFERACTLTQRGLDHVLIRCEPGCNLCRHSMAPAVRSKRAIQATNANA